APHPSKARIRPVEPCSRGPTLDLGEGQQWQRLKEAPAVLGKTEGCSRVLGGDTAQPRPFPSSACLAAALTTSTGMCARSNAMEGVLAAVGRAQTVPKSKNGHG
ncbi:unnamed protein product, partial [Urochloa humidicola]